MEYLACGSWVDHRTQGNTTCGVHSFISLSRYIKESIFIRVNNPTLNNNVGKFNLPHIWDRVLINTPGLKLNN